MLCLTVTVLFAGLAYAADFSATPLAGTAPLTVRFTDLSTDSPTQWNWTFGDGARSNGGNPIHTYAAPVTTASRSKRIPRADDTSPRPISSR